MTTPEGKVKKQVKEFLNSLGEDCWHYGPVPTGYGRKGIADILGCYRGKFFALEVKAPGKENMLTVWQERENLAIWKAQGVFLVVSDAEDLKAEFVNYFK